MNVQMLRASLSNHRRAVRVGIISLIVIAIAVTSTVVLNLNSESSDDELIARSTIVSRGNIQSTITGSGALTPAERVTLSASGTTTITELPFKVGDMVKKGQVIFALDDTEVTQTVFQNQDNLSQSQSDLEATQDSIKSLNIVAPSSGVITNISVNQGDTIQKDAPVLTLANESTYKLSVPFDDEDAKNIQIGDSAEVYIQSLMSAVTGTVTYKGNTSYAAENGAKLRDVDIQIKNPGSIKEGFDATAEVTKSGHSFSSTNSGKLTCKSKYSLKCKAGGTVKRVNVRLNQYVRSGQLLVSVENDELVRSLKTGQSKLKTQQDQLEYSQEQKVKYVAYAPIDGEIVQQNYKLGDSVKQGDSVAVIADVSKMEFSIPIDELDIAKIQVGQQVNVTVDALTQTSLRPLTGVVAKIAPEGTSTNGVSTYPVTISVSSTSSVNSTGSSNRNRSGFGGFSRQPNVNTSNQGGFPSGHRGNMAYGGNTRGTNNGNSGRQRVRSSDNTNIQQMSTDFQNNSTKNSQKNPKNNVQNNPQNSRVGLQRSFTLLSGMNANAEIIISGKSDVLSIPIEAVHRFGGKSYVIVKSTKAKVEKLKKQGKYIDIFSSTASNTNNNANGYGRQNSSGNNSTGARVSSNRRNSSQNNSNGQNGRNTSGNGSTRGQMSYSMSNNEQLKEYYSIGIPTEIEIGVNNAENIEVLSGLKEGQEIMLPPTIKSSTTPNTGTSGLNGFGGMSGFGGSGFGGNGMSNFGGNRVRNSGSAGRN